MRFTGMLAIVALTLAASAIPVTGALAQLAGRTTEGWLATLGNPARTESLRVQETVAALKLRPGDVVADIGAGIGAFDAELAAAVGPAGKVYAEEVDQGLVDTIAKRVEQFGIRNVTTVLGRFDDPALPAADVDLAFIHDVLHHVENRAAFLTALARYIEPGGRIALVEFQPGRAHLDQPGLLIPKDQAHALMAGAGFYPVEDITLSADKYFVIYARR
jgi:ubiquinone/menaquinone biosynthesis C-methylase UbiE